MALIDPKSYVSLPPGLIYGAEDLERETYKALLQIVGWMWVCRWWETNQPVHALRTNIGELARRWGVAERTVYHRLKTLAEKGYLSVEYGSSLSITLGPRALQHTPQPQPAPDAGETNPAAGKTSTGGDTQQAARGGDTGHERWHTQNEPQGQQTPAVTHNRPREAATQATRGGDTGQAAGATGTCGDTHQAARGGNTTGHERWQTQDKPQVQQAPAETQQAGRPQAPPPDPAAMSPSRASSLHEPTINSSSCSRSDLEDLPDRSKPTTTTINATACDPADPQTELRTTLLDGGVFPDRVSRLASDPWVTVDRVERWILDLQRQLEQDPGCIRSAGAVLYSNLLNHREPPPRPLTWTQKWQAWVEDAEEAAPAVVAASDEDDVDNAQQQLWRTSLGELQLQMTRATFDTWLRGSKVVAAENGTLTVGVRHAYAVDWLQNRLMPVIKRTVERHAGREITVEFVAL